MSRPARFPPHGPELRALLAACHADPDDDTPRLVLADWLEEHDDPRGELVRLQCRLDALPADDPAYDELFGRHEVWWARYGGLWEKEVGTLIWDAGPHDRGLPTVGYYDEEYCWLNVDDVGDPGRDRVADVVAAGWPGFTWAFLPYDLAGEWHDDGRRTPAADVDPAGPFARPPWSDSPTPLGVAFPEDAHVTAALLDRVSTIPRLRGLSLADTDATGRVLRRVAAMTQLERLDLGWVRLTDTGLLTLAPLTRLRTLLSTYSGRDEVTDTGARFLGNFPGLRELRLWSFGLTPAGFAAVGRLSGLEVLEVRGATDAGVARLRGLTRLRDWDLTGAEVSGRGLEHFPRLTRLVLSSTNVDDAGLARLAGLRRLRNLHLDDTRVAGPGLAHLAGLTWLEFLSLTDTRVGDEHLAHLEGLTRLENLYLGGTRVTKAGVARLRKKLKKTEIEM